MKTMLLLLICMLVVTPVTTQAAGCCSGWIAIFVDAAGSYCGVRDTPGMVTLYMIQKHTSGSTGASFRIEFSDGFAGALASVSSPYTNVTGDPLTGMTVMYDNTCAIGDVEILELHLLLTGTSPECSWVRVAPYPVSVDCNFEEVLADWGGAHVQHNLNLRCPDVVDPSTDIDFYCRPYTEPLATQSATWGAVKALYR